MVIAPSLAAMTGAAQRLAGRPPIPKREGIMDTEHCIPEEDRLTGDEREELRRLDSIVQKCNAASEKSLEMLLERLNDKDVKRGEVESILQTVNKANVCAIRSRNELLRGPKTGDDDASDDADREAHPGLQRAAEELATRLGGA